MAIFIFRDVIEKLFPDAIKEKYEDIEQNNEITRALQAFNKYGDEQNQTSSRSGRANLNRGGGGFFSGVLTALTGVAVSDLIQINTVNVAKRQCRQFYITFNQCLLFESDLQSIRDGIPTCRLCMWYGKK